MIIIKVVNRILMIHRKMHVFWLIHKGFFINIKYYQLIFIELFINKIVNYAYDETKGNELSIDHCIMILMKE